MWTVLPWLNLMFQANILGKVCIMRWLKATFFYHFAVDISGLPGPDSIWDITRISLRPIFVARLAYIATEGNTGIGCFNTVDVNQIKELQKPFQVKD